MKRKTFDVPVLFIIFRRKDTALQVIEAIAQVKPKNLYISQDGPRNKNEEKDVVETRKAVLSRVSWDCKLTIWTHKKNLGFKKHIPGALNNFFKDNKYGIYLEDDTVPNNDFFYFQKVMLEKYKDDKRIFSISGANLYSDLTRCGYSYYLSKVGSVWGCGLWRRSWHLYDVHMNSLSGISGEAKYKSYFFNRKYRFYLESLWKAIKVGGVNSWAMQFVYAAITNNMYFITPKVNLVNNIGVNKSGSNPSLQNYRTDSGNIFPLRHPKFLKYSRDNDVVYFSNMLKGGWLRLVLMKIYLSLSPEIKLIIRKLMGIEGNAN